MKEIQGYLLTLIVGERRRLLLLQKDSITCWQLEKIELAAATGEVIDTDTSVFFSFDRPRRLLMPAPKRSSATTGRAGSVITCGWVATRYRSLLSMLTAIMKDGVRKSTDEELCRSGAPPTHSHQQQTHQQ